MQLRKLSWISKTLLVHSAACLLAGITLTGCAFSRTTVKIPPAVVPEEPLPPSPKATLQVGMVKDSRLVADPMVLLHKANEYGTTSGAYVTEKPVADIFRDALTDALQKSGFVSSNAPYELRSDIQSFGIGVIQKMFSAATIKPFMTVRFELVDRNTGQSVWHDTYESQDTSKASWGVGEWVAESFSKVSAKAIQALLADQTFRAHFISK